MTLFRLSLTISGRTFSSQRKKFGAAVKRLRGELTSVAAAAAAVIVVIIAAAAAAKAVSAAEEDYEDKNDPEEAVVITGITEHCFLHSAAAFGILI